MFFDKRSLFIVLLTCNPASPKATNLLLLLSNASWNVCKHFARSSCGGSRNKPCCFSKKSARKKIVLNTKETNPKIWEKCSMTDAPSVASCHDACSNWRKLKKQFCAVDILWFFNFAQRCLNIIKLKVTNIRNVHMRLYLSRGMRLSRPLDVSGMKEPRIRATHVQKCLVKKKIKLKWKAWHAYRALPAPIFVNFVASHCSTPLWSAAGDPPWHDGLQPLPRDWSITEGSADARHASLIHAHSQECNKRYPRRMLTYQEQSSRKKKNFN